MANQADVFRKLEQVSLGSAVHVLRVLHELGRGDAPRAARPEHDSEGSRDVVFDLARALLTGYEGFLRFRERYFDVVTDGLRGLYYPRMAPDGAVGRERLTLEGRLGDFARGRFRLENEQTTDVELTFRFGEFVTANDDRRFPVAVTVGPPGASVARASDRRLAAGERRVFEVAVHLDPKTFQPWQTYVGDIQVVRDGQIVGELTLEVLPKP